MKNNKNLYPYIEQKEEQVAYLIGAIMGDGCYTIKDICVRPRFIYCSSDKDFILLIKQLIKQLFKVDLNVNVSKLSKKNPNWRDNYKISSRTLYRELSYYLPDHKILSNFIKEGSIKIKAAFISGFFDAEGGVSISYIKCRKAIDRRLHCSNQNLELLKTIKNYLRIIKIKSFIMNYPTYHTLNIWGFSNCILFRQKIGFRMERKKDKLNKLIESYKEIHKRGNEIIYNKVIELSMKTGKNIEKIKKQLVNQGIELQQHTIERWIQV